MTAAIFSRQQSKFSLFVAFRNSGRLTGGWPLKSNTTFVPNYLKLRELLRAQYTSMDIIVQMSVLLFHFVLH